MCKSGGCSLYGGGAAAMWTRTVGVAILELQHFNTSKVDDKSESE
jgi:hypothetical protein